MEFSSATASLWDYTSLFILRPLVAVCFALALLVLGWFLAWRLVLAHVPLVQEILGMRKKPVKPKPDNRRRLTQFYNSRFCLCVLPIFYDPNIPLTICHSCFNFQLLFPNASDFPKSKCASSSVRYALPSPYGPC